jgi:serine/threonine protein kinase
LHSGNLDGLIRKGDYSHGFPFNSVINIMKQLIHGLSFVHNKLNVCHADLKTDNILLKGNNKYISYVINSYNNLNFNQQYSENKKMHTNKLSPDKKKMIKSVIHRNLCSKIFNDIDNNINLTKYDIDPYLIENCNICIADFGNFVEEGEYYDESYGTIYYRSPENTLILNHTNNTTYYSNDIWALGCIFYELLTGKILFDPDKDQNYSREMHHLKLINELCGNYSHDFLKKTIKYKNYFDTYDKLKCTKELGIKNIVETELKRVVPSNYYDKIKNTLFKLLTIDPSKRLNINECVQIFNYF